MQYRPTDGEIPLAQWSQMGGARVNPLLVVSVPSSDSITAAVDAVARSAGCGRPSVFDRCAYFLDNGLIRRGRTPTVGP